MGKTRFCWVICIIILGLVAPAVAQDSSLVGWWKMDGDGTDSSGNGHDGVLEGDAHFAAGYLGQALALDGDGDYFAATDYKGLLSSSPTTVTTWVQTTGNGDMVYWGRSGGGRRVEFRVNGGRLRIDNGRGNLQVDMRRRLVNGPGDLGFHPRASWIKTHYLPAKLHCQGISAPPGAGVCEGLAASGYRPSSIPGVAASRPQALAMVQSRGPHIGTRSGEVHHRQAGA